MAYPKLKTPADPAQYKKLAGKKALLDNKVVTVISAQRDTQYGSWERGFKWVHTTYGVLRHKPRPKTSPYYIVYSADHGATWHATMRDALKVRKGKVVLEKQREQEFAFDGIQEINRKWDAGYKWRP